MIASLDLNPEDVVLGQGTLRPDLIESASALVSGGADTIKTHHNDSGLVRKLRETGRVVEPLKDFHKDEVITNCFHISPFVDCTELGKIKKVLTIKLLSLKLIQSSKIKIG